MNDLSRCLKAIRERKNISLSKVSRITGIPLEELELIEKKPERTPLRVLGKFLDAANVTTEEFCNFNLIASSMFYRPSISMKPVFDKCDFSEEEKSAVRLMGLPEVDSQNSGDKEI